ncbi:hypothetical protein V6N11_045155 [Hibiscus sabdariffa]|uniref:Uncharacterized protein n=2 Tax=Hibiscus sabdariffa TaxID=183260 RepID=A0ABR2BBS1_9ROSI
MSLEVAKKEIQQPTPPTADRNGNGVAVSQSVATMNRLRLNPNTEHKPDSYEGLQLDFSPLLFSSLERYLPPPMLSYSRDSKLNYMRDIILRYSPEGERTREIENGHAIAGFNFIFDWLTTGSKAARIQAKDYITLSASS